MLVMYSIKFTTLANASLLNVAPWPIFAALFAPLFFRESITIRLIIGGAIALVGVALIILGGANGFDWSAVAYNVLFCTVLGFCGLELLHEPGRRHQTL
jgi:drug/metabolite transporter (DMT)-like permease